MRKVIGIIGAWAGLFAMGALFGIGSKVGEDIGDEIHILIEKARKKRSEKES